MISFLFFSILFACFLALIVGTLGDEIQDLIRRFLDVSHQQDFSQKELRNYYQESRQRQQ